MLKFFRKHPPKESEGRETQKKELFGFRHCVNHGFPSKPSALAYDPKIRLLGIGTKTGAVRVYGAPGVEYSGQHKEDVQVTQLFFLAEQGRLISLCGDNSLHLWEINNTGDGKSKLEEIKSFAMESNKVKTISACSLTKNGEHLLLGTEGGNIHILEVSSFTLMDQIIYQDVVMQNVPDDFKVNPGAVEAIAVHPTNPDKFLIGYNRGLIVLWDNTNSNADQTYNATQQLESLCWHRNGEEFVSAHGDGSYIVWSRADASHPKDPALTPYGPFPCKAIGKLDYLTSKVDNFVIFSGGMPRASYGDRHTVSIMQGSNHVVFDLTSKIVDFISITRAMENDTEDERAEYDEPHSLIILVEEELVIVDLDSPKWPLFNLPYINSLHCSAVTCSQHITNVPDQLWQKLVDSGEAQMKQFSSREWPINGGKVTSTKSSSKDLILTGHEDGSVRFWDASAMSLCLLFKLNTSSIFQVDVHSPDSNNGEMEEEWPPFRKVGNFDPYSDDPRLAIQKISLCPLSETLVVAGTAGQTIILQMEREERELEVPTVTVNIVEDKDSFVWKGHEAIIPRTGIIKFVAGFQPTCIMQLYPPAACTALAIHSEWQLVGAGTAHGFALFDYQQKKAVTTRCTLNPHELTGTSDTPMSRRKSLKKSLRESFRRLRNRRSERRHKTKEEVSKDKKIEETHAEAAPSTSAGAAGEGGATASTPEHRPVERAVEARSSDDSMASMVRCIYFADTFIVNATSHNHSLWVGTNGGHVYIYTLVIPGNEKRNEEVVSCSLAKEIKLRHKAPVIAISVIDGKAKVLPEALDVQHERAKAPDMSGQHTVVICSEEQLKIFTLPQLKAKWKFKITAIDGARVRRVGFINFRSRSDENYVENDVVCLTNLGDLSIFSIETLRQQMTASVIRKEDINGITSLVFTKYGQAFYLHSPSEFSRITLSAWNVVEPKCEIELKEGMRPAPAEEPSAARPVGELDVSGQPYSSTDISEGLNESVQNESRADTTLEGEVTQDSIRIAEHTNEDIVTEVTIAHVTVTSTTVSPPSESTTVTATTDGGKTKNVDDIAKAVTVQSSTTVETEVREKMSDLKVTVHVHDDDPALSKQKGIAETVENGHDEVLAVS
ncbi:hypothetical protein ACJMK2_033799 [Sinanodonta woodiana]|uniref:Lethal giant larvae homologue 2 domain-containing protein n=1 Tax=Sinanodonta woodiana TaxID=1069815 RepID=A0ABD3WQ21_SINWO